MNTVYKHNGKVFYNIEKLPKKDEVFIKMGVREKTFAGNMVSRMYDYYFKDSISFRKEYKKYYHKEFKSITEYIEQRYDITYEEAKRYVNGNYATKDCSHLSVERGLETLNHDEEFRDAFSNAVGGLVDEDKDWLYY